MHKQLVCLAAVTPPLAGLGQVPAILAVAALPESYDTPGYSLEGGLP